MTTERPRPGRAKAYLYWSAGITAIGAGFVIIASLMQLALSYYYCTQDLGSDLSQGRSATGRLELDLTPVVVCDTAAGTTELPLAGAVVSLGAGVLCLVAVLVLLAVHRFRE